MAKQPPCRQDSPVNGSGKGKNNASTSTGPVASTKRPEPPERALESKPVIGAQPGRTYGLTFLSTVEPEKVEWLWKGRLPLGKITILDGDPGLGRSTLSLHLAACVSTGDPLPGDTKKRAPAGVILRTAEDGLADTIRPRLDAAGVDSTKMASFFVENGSLSSFPSTLEACRWWLRRLGPS